MGVFGLTVLGSGSGGNASVVHGPEGALLVDAGFSAKELEKRMEQREIDPDSIRALLITHEHGDHTKGCRVFADRHGIDVYMSAPVCKEAARCGFLPEHKVLFAPGNPFDLCGMHIEPFTLPHDAMDTVGFLFEAEGQKIGIATDLGHVNVLAKERLHGCGILMLESNHDPDLLRNSGRPLSLKRRILSRHGHLSNEDACSALAEMITEKTRDVIFAHISAECNDRDLVENLALQTLANLKREDILYKTALQDSPLESLWLV